MSREVRLSDRIKELSYDPGTSRFALTGPVDGFSPFSDFYQQGDVVFYAATDGTRYEVGSGEYTLDGSTKVLTRYPLRSSSLSSGPYYVNDESTSGPTKGTTGYFHPLYLMESSASGLRGYPTQFGTNPPTAVHEHHFAKYPGITFYMPQEYTGHAETVGGGAPAALSGVNYAVSGAPVSFQGVTEVFVTYPGKYSVFSAHGVSGYQEPKHGGVAVWGSEQILDYDRNIVWNFDNEALGISQPSPFFPIDVGGASSYSQVRASGFIDGGSGIAFSGGQTLPQDILKTASGGHQLEPFFRNELDNQTKSDQLFSLSGLVDQRLLLKMQEKGTIFAGPPSGCSTVGCDPDYPHFRYLELEDIPDLSDLYVVQKNLIDASLVPVGAVPHWDASGVIVYDPNFVYKSATDRLGVGTDDPQTALDVNGDITASGNIYASGLAEIAGDLMVRGDVTVSGGLDIQGSLTYIDSTTITLLDKQIELASMSGSAPDNYNDAFIDDGGIVLKGTQGDKKWTWRDATDSWTTDQGIDTSGITFNDLSVISGAYHPGSGLELHNQIELHVGNLFQVSGEDGTNCFIHQGGALIASGISGINTSVTRIGNSGRLLIDPTHLRQELLDKHTSSTNLVGNSGNRVFDAASGLIHNSGNFLLSSGISVSGWSRHYTNARVGDSGNKVFDAVVNSGQFIISSGIQVSGWSRHYTNAKVGDSGNKVYDALVNSGQFIITSGIQASGWSNYKITKTNTTITELSGITSGVAITLHNRISKSGQMLKDLIGGGSSATMDSWTISVQNQAAATASEALSDADVLNIKGVSGIATEYTPGTNLLTISSSSGNGGPIDLLFGSGNKIVDRFDSSGNIAYDAIVRSGQAIINRFDSSGNIAYDAIVRSGQAIITSGIQVSGWSRTYTDTKVGDSGNKAFDAVVNSGQFIITSGIQVSGWSRTYTNAKVGDSGNKAYDAVVDSGQTIISKFDASGQKYFNAVSGQHLKNELGTSGNFLNDRITSLTEASDAYGHWKSKVTNSFGTKILNISSTDSLEYKSGGTASGVNIQFDTSANQIQFGLDYASGNKIVDRLDSSGNTIVDRFDASGNINSYKVDLSGQLLAGQIGSVINYGHWHVRATNQAAVTVDEEVISNQTLIFKGQSGIATEYIPGTNTLTISSSSGNGGPIDLLFDSGNKIVDRFDASGNTLDNRLDTSGNKIVDRFDASGNTFVDRFDSSGNKNLFLIRVSGQRAVQVSSGLFTEVSGSLAAADTYLTQRIDTSGQKFFSAVSGQHLKNELGTSGNYLSDFLSASGQNIENKFNFAYNHLHGSGRVAIESGIKVSGLLTETSGNIFAHVLRQSGVFQRQINENSGIVVQLSGQAITTATSGLHIVDGVNSAKTVKLDPQSSGEIRSLMFRRRGTYEDIRIGREAGIAQKFGASNDIAGSFFDSYGISNSADGGGSISIGTKAGYNTVRSSRTILIGQDAGSEASGISDIIAIGQDAAKGIISADYFDIQALSNDDTKNAAVQSVFIGKGAGENLQLKYGLADPYINEAVGLSSQKDGYHLLTCSSFGSNSLFEAKLVSTTTAIGPRAGERMANNSLVTAIGNDAGADSSGITNSTFIGPHAGYDATKVPNQSLSSNLIGVGMSSMFGASGSQYSIGIGYYAGRMLPLSSLLLASLGWDAMSDTQRRSSSQNADNIYIGREAGYTSFGSNNIYIGREAGKFRGGVNGNLDAFSIGSVIIVPGQKGAGYDRFRTQRVGGAQWFNKTLSTNALDYITLLGCPEGNNPPPLGGHKSSFYVGKPQDITDFNDYQFTIDRHNDFLGGLKLRGASSTTLPFLMAETSVAAYPENEIINNHGFLTLPGAGSSSTEKFYYRHSLSHDFNYNYSFFINNPRRIYDKNGNEIPTEEGMVVIVHRLRPNHMPTDNNPTDIAVLCVRQGNKWQFIRILDSQIP